MRKSPPAQAILLAVLLFLTGSLTAGSRKTKIWITHPPQLVFENISSIAVMEFDQMNTGVRGPYAAELTDRITAAIAQSRKFEIVDRMHLEALMKEKKFQWSGIVDEKTIKELNKMLGATLLLIGRITRFSLPSSTVMRKAAQGYGGILKWGSGNTHQRITRATLVASMQIIDVATGTVYAPSQADGSVEIITEADDGPPPEVDPHLVLSQAYEKTVNLLTRPILSWKESVEVEVYDDNEYDLKLSCGQIQAGQYRQAVETISAAIEANGGEKVADKGRIKYLSRAFHNMGVALMGSGSYDDAMSYLRRSRNLADSGQTREAIVACQTMIDVQEQGKKIESRNLWSGETRGAEEEEEVVTNAVVMELVRQKVGEKVIIEMIQSARKCDFKISAAAIIELKKAGASDEIINAMQIRARGEKVPQ